MRDNGAKSRREKWVQAILRADNSGPVRDAIQTLLYAVHLNNYHTQPMMQIRQRLAGLAGFDFTDDGRVS